MCPAPVHEPTGPADLDLWFAPLFRHAVPSPAALAVSGGSDSTALMVLFAEWLRGRASDPAVHTVLTVDHGLRAQAADEARAVEAQAHALGYAHATLQWRADTPPPSTGVQAAARTARYRLMAAYMRAHGLNLLLTGHTRDDQAETVLMRLARGSGLDGLAGMAAVTDLAEAAADPALEPGALALARPLLDVPKARLLAALAARHTAWIEDPSNQSPAFERVRLRAAKAQLEALGLTDAMLALSARRLRRARAAVQRDVERYCSAQSGAVRIDPCGSFALDRERLHEAEEEVALRVVGRAVAAAGGSAAPVPLARLEAIVRAIRTRGPQGAGRWTLARAMLTAEPEVVTIEREPGRGPLPTLTLSPGATAEWDGRFRLHVGPAFADGAVEVRALGHHTLSVLGLVGADASSPPARMAALVPSFWRGGNLLAVPSLAHWRVGLAPDLLQAQFMGLSMQRQGTAGANAWQTC